ncbi:hypothetical protein BX666DRAFT_1969475 [Dichotomocladium elegans]|nr:hypothetical protein BX666DRAFT_1969475 [Dichotomocladium elegans]
MKRWQRIGPTDENMITMTMSLYFPGAVVTLVGYSSVVLHEKKIHADIHAFCINGKPQC